MDNIEKLIECFKTHIGSKDKISPYSCTKKGKGGEFIFLDGVNQMRSYLYVVLASATRLRTSGKLNLAK